MSRTHGWLLLVQFLVAAYFAATEDWTWFAIAALGCFCIYAWSQEDPR